MRAGNALTRESSRIWRRPARRGLLANFKVIEHGEAFPTRTDELCQLRYPLEFR
jgi:hypothetical protein